MIQLSIKNESDLYNPYDPSWTRINEGVYQYLKSYCTNLEASKQTYETLQIITESAIDQEKFQKTLHNAVKRDIAEFDMQIAINNRIFIWEIIAGILLSAVGILLAIALDKVLLAIISFLGSMCFKDAIPIQARVNHDLKRLKKRLIPISEIKVEVVQRNA